MFSRAKPREVYRVYGEDDFFAEQDASADGYQDQQVSQEDQGHQVYQDQQASQEDHQGYQDYPQPQVAALQPEHQPQFDQQPEPVQHFAPQPPVSQPPAEQYAPPTETYAQPVAPVFAGERSGGQPRPPKGLQANDGGVYGAAGNRRRNAALIALAGVLGLLLGLLLISSLHSGGGKSKPQASAPPVTHPAPQVSSPTRSSVVPTPAHSSPTVLAHHAIHARAHITLTRAPSRPASDRLSIQPRLHAAPVHTPAPSSTPATASVPAPVSAPTPSYAPPSSSQTGSEFGFEN